MHDIQFTDQMGREIRLDKKPLRIVSLVPSQTELLVSLGLEEYIVGVTKFCVHPIHLKKVKKVVGGTKKVSFEKIKDLHPDIILCNKEENTKEIVTELAKEYPVHVSDISTIHDTLEMIRQYGEIFQVSDKAIEIIESIKKKVIDFEGFIKDKPMQRVLYVIWRDPWMSVGEDTFIHHLLACNNYVNVMEGRTRYPQVTDEELKDLTIDTVLLSSEPFPFKEKHIKEIKTILPEVDVLLVDGEYFSWYGSRLEEAFDYFKTLHRGR